MNTATKAYEEIVEFIAAGTTPGAVISFHPSPESKKRVEELISKEKSHSLLPDEKSELGHYMQLEHLMRLAKSRARKYTVQ